MLRALRKKRVLAALGLVAALATAGIAVAYFSTSGSGAGNAQVGTSSALTINATITPGTGGIVPGGANAGVSFTATNPGGGNQEVATVSLASVTAYSDSAHTNNITGTGPGKCDTTAFSMTPVNENTDVPGGGATTQLPSGGQLAFADTGQNQDGCKNAFLVANFTSN